jgi:DNA-binding response OmpR family regulator/two-component sensor histidine kinase
VLIVDDSLTVRMDLAEAFGAAGFRTLPCATAREAREALSAHPIGLIVLDVLLPDADGIDFLKELREGAGSKAPVLILSSEAEVKDRIRGLKTGADEFVGKPYDAVYVVARARELLRGQTENLAADQATVLVIDDSVTYLEEIGAVLREDGYEVALARTGEEALELLSVQPVDCILLDVLMPGLGGQETCRRIKAAPVMRDIPLIMLTALEEREAMIDGLATGADDYISKSGEFEVLKARVAAQLRRKQFEDENRQMRSELFTREIEATEARAARELSESRAILVAELERKNKELEAFSYSVSHDLRAPLRSIDGFSQALLQEYSEGLDTKARGYLGRVRSSARRMGELIDDLLELSRVSRADLVRGSVDLSALARSVLAELARREPERRVEVDVLDTPPAEADARLLRVALENLIGNAWKFTAKVGQARIEFRAEKAGEGQTAYQVRDNGAGFQMQYASKLFQPFQRLHAESEFSGTGIGLATVHRIVERHGGRVWTHSAPNEGATFSFTLPPAGAAGRH